MLCSIASIRSPGLLRVLALVGVAVSAPGCASTPKPTVDDEIVVRLVAVTWRGEFLAEDPQDGFLVPVGHTGFTRINSLTVTPDDRVLSVAQQDDGANPVLIEIDPATGRGTVVCTLDRVVDVRALAAGPDGSLYAMLARPEADERATLALVDGVTGRVTVLRDYNESGVNSLEFCAHGHLFAHRNWRRAPGPGRADRPALLDIAPDDGRVRVIESAIVDRDVQSLAFDAEDVGHLAWCHSQDHAMPCSIIQQAAILDDGLNVGVFVVRLDPGEIRGIGFLGAHRARAVRGDAPPHTLGMGDTPTKEQAR